jgi:hypothetical protein
MSWETLEEILTSSVGFIIAMVVLTAVIGVGLYGYWVYVNHQTLENYLWPVAEVVPLRNGTYYLGIVNTGNEPIIVEDIYTNNSEVLSVNPKPLSHNQWFTEALDSLPVAVRVCSALDPKVCEVVPVHGWGYARLFGGVWVNVTGQACNFEFWKILWYNGSGGLIWESQDLSWFIPTNQTVNFIAKVYGWTTCTSTLVSSQKIGNNTIENCYQETCNYPVINGPSSAEPGEDAIFTLGCGTSTSYYCETYTINNNNTNGNGNNNNGNNTGQPPGNSTNGPPPQPPGNNTNNPPPPQYYCTVYASASDTVNGASNPTVNPPSATLKPGEKQTFKFSTDTSLVTEGNTTYTFKYWDINGNNYNSNPAQYTFTCPSSLSGNETYYINGVAVFQAQSSGGNGGGNGGPPVCNP